MEGSGQGTGQQAGATNPAGQQAQQGQQAPPAGGAGAGDRTFTQEQVNQFIAREKGDLQRQYADYEDLKTKASEFDKLQDAQKTELQKAQDQAAAAELARDGALTALQTARVESAVVTLAARKGLVDPDAATKLLDPASLQFDKAGKPTNVDQLLDDLVKERPYLAGNGKQRTSFDAGARPAGQAGEDMNTRIRRMAGRG